MLILHQIILQQCRITQIVRNHNTRVQRTEIQSGYRIGIISSYRLYNRGSFVLFGTGLTVMHWHKITRLSRLELDRPNFGKIKSRVELTYVS